MTEDLKNKIALFRFSIISPLVSGIDSSKSINEFFSSASLKAYIDPYGKSVHVAASTIERWYYSYKKHGFDALKPQRRNDFGRHRKIDFDLASIINHYIDTHPRLPSTTIRELMIENGDITNDDISLSTINRYVNSYKKNKDVKVVKEMKRYECEHINTIWCCDTSYSFKLNVGNEKKRTYIIAIIDDASRLIVGCDVFFNDNYVNYMSVLKNAITKYGKPKILNVDNGAPYKNGQIELLAARTGITLRHCAPYEPTSKAKIERWFRTMKDHFMASFHLTSKISLNEFRAHLHEYVIKYNNTIHSSLNGKTPNERFFNSDDEILYLKEIEIESNFLLEVDRKVTADGIVSLDSKEFEVPYKYQNKRIKIRYSSDYKTVYVVEADGELTKINIVDKIANSKLKRIRINYNTEEI